MKPETDLCINRKSVSANDAESLIPICILMHDHKSLQQTILKKVE